MKNRDTISVELRYSALQQYYSDGLSISELAERLSISRSSLYRIINNFASTNPEIVAAMKKSSKKSSSSEELARLKSEILRLKQELEDAKMRAHVYDTMIDVAEEMFNIPIRKKSGPKQ